MGNTGSSKLNYRDVVQQLRTNQDTPKSFRDEFWRQFWPDHQLVDINELYNCINSADLRTLREDVPQNFAKLVVYCSEQLIYCSAKTFCNTTSQQNVALNCCRLLIRTMPYVFEDEDFARLLWTDVGLEEVDENKEKQPDSPRNFKQPPKKSVRLMDDDDSDEEEEEDDNDDSNENNQFASGESNKKKPLAVRLINAVCDLLFCPEFTVVPLKLSKKGSRSKSSGKFISFDYDFQRVRSSLS